MRRWRALVALLLCGSHGAWSADPRDRLSDALDGATCEYFNRSAGGAWARKGGDWRDADGVPYGKRAYASVSLSARSGTAFSIDVTPLARDWISGRADPLKGLLLRGVASTGIALLGSRDAADPRTRPRLVLTYANGDSVEIFAQADTYLDCTTEQSMGAAALLKAGGEFAALLRFELPSGRAGVDLAKAQLTLSLNKLYGEATLGVFAASPPESPDSASRAGVAAAYADDAGIDKAPGVLFAAGFEHFGWQLQWSDYGLTSRVEAIDADPAHGFVPLSGRALRVTIPRGGHLGLDLRYDFGHKLGFEPEEAYFRYYLRLASDWNPSVEGGKLPGFAGTYGRAGWGLRKSTGSDGWSLRGSFFVRGKSDNPYAGTTAIGTYAYHADISEPSGETWTWPLGRLGALDNNRWYCVEQFVKLNAPGKRDGVLRTWIDGRLAFERTNIRLRDVPQIRIESVWFNVYHGGTQPSPADMHLYIDNVVIASRYIGPMGTRPR